MNTPNDSERRAAKELGDLLALLEVEHPNAPSDEEFAAIGRDLAGNIRARLAQEHSAAGAALAPVTSLDSARRRPRPTVIPGLTTVQRAAASDDAGPRQEATDEVTTTWGLVFARSLTADSKTRVTVSATDRRRRAGEIVQVSIVDSERHVDLPIVLYADGDGNLVGQVESSAISLPDNVAVSVVEVVDLTFEMADDVTAVVRTSGPDGQAEWAGIAETLPDEHPIREAILDGLDEGF